MTRPAICAWCGGPAVAVVTVEPALYRTVTKTDPRTGQRVTAKECVRAAIQADACPTHREHARQRHPNLQKAPDHQLTIDDVLGGAA
jgi:hypothetical protein